MDKRIEIINEEAIGARPSWDEYMMHLAIGVSSRSSCQNVHSATIITSLNHRILATGYNGAGSKIKDNCLVTGCRKKLKGLEYHSSLGSGECIGVHSEMNALSHFSIVEENSLIIYTTIFPCHTCAKNITPYNIKKIVFKRFYSEKELSSTLEHFEEAGVGIFQLDLSPERDMDIRYNQKDAFFGVWSDEEKQRINNILRNIK